jgi:hypothetical protein
MLLGRPLGLGIIKLQIVIKKISNFSSALNFFQFLVNKTLDADWIRMRISIEAKMLNPDPE